MGVPCGDRIPGPLQRIPGPLQRERTSLQEGCFSQSQTPSMAVPSGQLLVFLASGSLHLLGDGGGRDSGGQNLSAGPTTCKLHWGE